MCEVCVMTVETLEKKLTKESTKDEIAKALETVCNVVAPSYRAQVSIYLPLLLVIDSTCSSK